MVRNFEFEIFLTFLDVVIGEGTAILQLFPGEDQPLLVRRNPWTERETESVKQKRIGENEN